MLQIKRDPGGVSLVVYYISIKFRDNPLTLLKILFAKVTDVTISIKTHSVVSVSMHRLNNKKETYHQDIKMSDRITQDLFDLGCHRS